MTQTKEPIKLILETRHFQQATNHLDLKTCPIGLAIKEQFNTSNYLVGGKTVDIKNTNYRLSANAGRYALTIEAMNRAKAGEEIKPVTVLLFHRFNYRHTS